jgi:hypothetical protein
MLRVMSRHMKTSNGRQVLSGDKMLQTHGTSFNPDRGIGQEDTPSTLIFIAVFEILLTLLEDSGNGDAHAYTQMILSTLKAQQRQADLVCGFATYTDIKISAPKVEAISVFNSRIMYGTPFLTLHDWECGTLTGSSTATTASGHAI